MRSTISDDYFTYDLGHFETVKESAEFDDVILET